MKIDRNGPLPGLTEAEAEKRRAAGQGNAAPDKPGKTTGQIFKENICTLFNLFNLLIALALAAVGAWSNMLFIVIVAANTCIGIAQELHAKKLIDQLSVLAAPKARALRDGVCRELPVEDLVLGDVIELESGMQIPADAVIVSGEAEVNEALLTGESDAIVKKSGSALLSGSFVVSGKCRAAVEHVGSDNYATRLTAKAKEAKTANSELLSSMRKVTRFTGFLIVPLGILLFIEAFFLRGGALPAAVTSTAAGLLGMLPKGLILLISVSLAVGVAKLAKAKVLVQNLFSLETLAHVDVLCLDKTGTLTEGAMQVEQVLPLAETMPAPLGVLLGNFMRCSTDNNATFQALAAHFPAAGGLEGVGAVAFSSQRKWSAVSFAVTESSGAGTLVLGAPDRMPGTRLPARLKDAAAQGARVLLAGWTCEPVAADLPLPTLTPLAGIVLSDPIRANAAQTLEYFRQEGVQVKVISGDHPATVSAIAQKAGLPRADAWVDMSTVTSEQEVAGAAARYAVFGRVSPEQKRQLVAALQARGHAVAMTGDGVNDILALRQADCSIAMAQGSDAARQVSQVVLMESDFSALPAVLSEGRRVVNNMTRVAGVFFVKTIYSILLSLFCVVCGIPFPFVPIQITLIDLCIEGYPAFFISFEPNGKKVTGQFLPSVLRRALPNALAIFVLVGAVLLFGPAMGIPAAAAQAVMYLLVGALGVEAVLKSCLPFNKLRAFLFGTTAVGYFTAVFLFHNILKLALPPLRLLPVILLLAGVGILIERALRLCWIVS